MNQLPPALSLPLPDLDLVLVEGGTFNMGDETGELPGKYPVHPATVSSFYMGKYPVTQRLWQAVMKDNPSYFKGDNRPVENVSWHDSQRFIEALNLLPEVQRFIAAQLPGARFRLPTEAEWEYAARGGRYSEGYRFAGSNRLGQVGWHDENNGRETREVGLLMPNELGLHDMSGNVWEWCQDWYGDYEVAPPPDYQGPDDGADRVLRGGSWFYGAGICRSAFRNRYNPGYRNNDIGFRLVLLP